MGLIRLFLAFIVVIDHLRGMVLTPASGLLFPPLLGMNAGFAVMFFYVISGFLISGALAKKYGGTLAGTMAFYRGRFVRIFSLYWPVAILVFLVLGAYTLKRSPIDWFTSFFLFGIDWRLSFGSYPAQHQSVALPGLGQAWTLGAEMTFYALAPFLLRSAKAVAAVFLVLAALRFFLVYKLGFDVTWLYTFAPSTFLFFLLGHYARAAGDTWPVLRNGYAGIVSIVAAACFLCLGGYAGWDGWRFWGATFCFALSLPGIFQTTKDSRLSNTLGELSFPAYLIHLVIIVLMVRSGALAVLRPLMTGDSGADGAIVVIFFLALVTLAATLTYWFVEIPTARLMVACGRLVQSPKPQASAP